MPLRDDCAYLREEILRLQREVTDLRLRCSDSYAAELDTLAGHLYEAEQIALQLRDSFKALLVA